MLGHSDGTLNPNGDGLGTVWLILLYTPLIFLEIRVIIKILKKLCYPINVDKFSLGKRKKKKKIWKKKKKFKMADSKKVFQPPPKAEQFPPKFHGLVLGLVGLINVKGIDLAQPVWSWGCPT